MTGFNPCDWYGHRWRYLEKQTSELPPGYVAKKCRWCGESKVAMEY